MSIPWLSARHSGGSHLWLTQRKYLLCRWLLCMNTVNSHKENLACLHNPHIGGCNWVLLLMLLLKSSDL